MPRLKALRYTPPIPMKIPPNPVRIVVVGTGGTGGYVAQGLAQTAAHLKGKGLPVPEIILCDGDHVEYKNVGRQPFSEQEIGFNKAMTLSHRLNVGFGLGVEAVPEMATRQTLSELAPPSDTIGILVGCVDTATGRRSIAESVHQWGWRFWIDCGNKRQSGQISCGTTTRVADLRGCLAMGGMATALPTAALVDPELLVEDDEAIEVEDCALALLSGNQSLGINHMMAVLALEYLRAIIIARELIYFRTSVALGSLRVTSQPITADALKAATGCTVHHLTTLPKEKPQGRAA